MNSSAPVPSAIVLSQPCEVCGESIEFEVLRGADGEPDMIRVRSPESAWLGYNDVEGSESSQLYVLSCCSQLCVVESRQRRHSPPALPSGEPLN